MILALNPRLDVSASPELRPQALASVQSMLISGTLEEVVNEATKDCACVTFNAARATL